MRLRRGGAVLLLALLVPVGGRAGPLLAPHPGGLGFFGPTDPDVPAIWWNAAALGELSGTHLFFSGAPVFLSQQLNLADSPPVSRLDIDPDLFIGLSTDFASEHIRFGIAYHVPFREHGSIGADADRLDPATHESPLKYQRLHTTWQNRFFSPVAVIRFNSSFSLGLGLNVLYSDAHISFDRNRRFDFGDQPLPETQNPNERIDVNGTVGWSVGGHFGFLWRILGRVTIGGAFISREAGLSHTSIVADRYANCDQQDSGVVCEQNAHVTRPGGEVANGYGDITYKLPDVVTFGARWLVSDRVEATAALRYADWGQRGPAWYVHLGSSALASAGVPQTIVLHRGFEDSYNLSARGAYCARRGAFAGEPCRLRLGLSVAFDTGMYDARAANADALDGPTLELGFLFEWRASRHVRLVGGASYGAMMTRRVTNSVFDLELANACQQAHHDAQACAGANAGLGVPSANGTYGLQSYTASVGMAFSFGEK